MFFHRSLTGPSLRPLYPLPGPFAAALRGRGMSDAWVAPQLAVFLFLAGGSILLGLACLAGGAEPLRRRGALAVPVGLAGLAAAGAALGQPPGTWLPPLGLAAACLACRAAQSAGPGRGALTLLRHPRLHGGVLLSAGVALAAFLTRGGEPPAGAPAPDRPLTEWPEFVAYYGLREARSGAAVTDRGRPVRTFVAARRPPRPGGTPASVQHHLRRGELLRLSGPAGDCNCHGWVFLGGRSWLLGEDVEAVLEDNGYRRAEAPRPGDLVVYRSADGVIRHSGVVLAVTEGGTPLVESKWGDDGLFAHAAEMPGYGRHEYYRSGRAGHHLRAPSAAAVAAGAR